MDVSPLPDVDIGKIIGLLEILEEYDGRSDVSTISVDLMLELDDILPIIHIARTLEFLDIYEGDIIIKQLGKDVIEKDENERKLIFKRALKKIPIFKALLDMLLASEDKSIEKSDFEEFLEKEMVKESAKTTLRSVVHFGRYAELIGYNPEEDLIYLDEIEEEKREKSDEE